MVANASVALLYPTLLTSMMRLNYTIFPNDEGVPQFIHLDHTPLSIDQLSLLTTNVNKTNFTLFTRKNDFFGEPLILNDVNSVKKSSWNPNKITALVTHGWTGSGDSSSCTLIRDAFLRALDLNVIVFDWREIADNILYSVVAKSVPSVAEHVASFVNFLRTEAGLNTSNFKIIGHSLGAHVASLSSMIVSKQSPVAEVIALDPAKPMFEGNGPERRVDSTHARDVQVIHTCAGLLGMSSSVGTSDFFANGGRNQPGCSLDVLGACAHGRSYEYYSESIGAPRGFLGISKDTRGKAYMGGLVLDPHAKGTYYFETTSQPPYMIAQ